MTVYNNSGKSNCTLLFFSFTRLLPLGLATANHPPPSPQCSASSSLASPSFMSLWYTLSWCYSFSLLPENFPFILTDTFLSCCLTWHFSPPIPTCLCKLHCLFSTISIALNCWPYPTILITSPCNFTVPPGSLIHTHVHIFCLTLANWAIPPSLSILL